ncbi:MAG: hypothetical protein GX933_08025 [Chloroflexi bacterium]|nr:hypothetical protein [Chloroflexota bacterium]
MYLKLLTGKKQRKILKAAFALMLLLVFLFFSAKVEAVPSVQQNVVNLYLFYGDGCSHCADEEAYLSEKQKEYGDQLVVHDWEVWYHPENVDILQQFAGKFGFEPSGVPVTFIGDQHWVGFSDAIEAEIEAAIENGLRDGVLRTEDIVSGVVSPDNPVIDPGKAGTTIKLPLIGEIDLSNKSLIVSTILIGLVDGVNPCSLWVLTMLLAMIVHTHSRRKTLIIGFVFLTVSALIYALFISGVFTLLNYVSYFKWIQIAVAILTLILGMINLKDYFFFKKGVSLTISDDKKPGLYQKMRDVMNKSDNLCAMVGATILLSAGVSLVEFSCTAAFPVIWSNLLVSHNTSNVMFIALLILYMLLYQLDEMIIFGVVVAKMKSSRMEEKHGQTLKLFSGCLMVVLSLVMIINPALMENLGITLIVFGVAVLLTITIYLLADKVLPKHGIYIGHNKPKELQHKPFHKNTP